MKRFVLDAGIGLALLVPVPYSLQVRSLVERWRARDAELFAPALWDYEVVSTVRKYVAAGVLSADDASTATTGLAELGIERIAPSAPLSRSALRWAAELGQRAAYDAAYLALAESLDATLYTADLRLANRARQLRLTWVRSVQDEEGPAGLESR
jgi:predicted nucleic acid-binding protein